MNDILTDFVDKLNSDSYIEDFDVSYAYVEDDCSAVVCLQSHHNVYDYKGFDYFNNFSEYIRRVFSSSEWKDFIKFSKKDFNGVVNDMSDKINEEYHSEIEDSIFVFKDKLRSDFSHFVDRNFEGSNVDAWDVDFEVILQPIDYFPVNYLKEKYDSDRANKYNLINSNIVREYLNKVLSNGVKDDLFNVREVYEDDKSLNISFYINRRVALKQFKREIDSLFERSDFIRFVKHPILFANPDKLAVKFNKEIRKVIFDSENYNNLTRDIKDDFTSYVSKLYNDNLITEEQYDDFFNYNVKIEKFSTAIFDKEYIAFKADKERSKKKYSRRRK